MEEGGWASATCFRVSCVACAQFNGLLLHTPAYETALKPSHKKSPTIQKLPQSSFVNSTPLKGGTDGFNSQRLSI